MDVREALRQRRTIRKFTQQKISLDCIKQVVSLARLCPSAANLQYIECGVIAEQDMVDKVFEHTRWAGYLSDGRPKDDERPVAFIAVVANTLKSPQPDLRDIGAFVQSLLLAFLEEGIAGCWIESCDKDVLMSLLKLPAHCVLDSVVALGGPAQEAKTVTYKESVKYYVDKQNVLCVPKRDLKDIMFVETYGRHL